MTESKVIFTAKDIDYLCLHFDLAQLKCELHHADIEASVSAYFEDEWQFYWRDYSEAVKMAIDILRANQPVAKPIKSHIDTEAIKSRHGIVAVIEGYMPLRKSGNRFSGVCPFHTHKNPKNPSLTVYPDNQSWYCFGCNKGGDVIDFVQLAENTDFKGAATVLGGA